MHIHGFATPADRSVHPGTRVRALPAMLLVALLSAVLMVAGCGGDSATPDGGGPGDDGGGGAGATPDNSCDVFSREEAAAAAGNPVKDGKLLGFVCIWEPEDIDNEANLQVSVGYLPVPPGGDVNAVCQASLAGIPDAKPFAGVGNSAYWDFGEGGRSNTGSLHVCFDGGMLDTSAIGKRSEGDLQQVAVSIAKTVLGRV